MRNVLVQSPPISPPREEANVNPKKALHIARCILLSISSLISSANAVHAQEGTEPKETISESTEQKNKQQQYLEKWMHSAEGGNMKMKLAEAVDQLDDPSFLLRQQATRTILESIKTLQAMIHPFPEELRLVLGDRLFQNNLFEEDARTDLRENHNCTWEQSWQLVAMKEQWEAESFHAIPRIMPGEYSVEELQKALEKQTGVTFLIDGQASKERIEIRNNENTWIDAVSALQNNIGGGILHYQPQSVSMCIDKNPDQDSEIFLNGTCIFDHKRGEYSSTSITQLPSKGDFIDRLESHSDPSHFIFLSPPPKFDIEDILCESYAWNYPLTSNQDKTRMIAFTVSPRKEIRLPLGEETIVGRHQVIRADKQKLADGYKVLIGINRTERLIICTNDGDMEDKTPEVVMQNSFLITDANGQAIEIMMEDSGTSNMGKGWYIEYVMDTEPTAIAVSYRESGRVISIELPEACLPKDANP